MVVDLSLIHILYVPVTVGVRAVPVETMNAFTMMSPS